MLAFGGVKTCGVIQHSEGLAWHPAELVCPSAHVAADMMLLAEPAAHMGTCAQYCNLISHVQDQKQATAFLCSND